MRAGGTRCRLLHFCDVPGSPREVRFPRKSGRIAMSLTPSGPRHPDDLLTNSIHRCIFDEGPGWHGSVCIPVLWKQARARRAAWRRAAAPALLSPLAARAQQMQAVPVIGYLSGRSPEAEARLREPFMRLSIGLCGWEERRDRVPFRGRPGHRLPALAAALVRLRPAVLVATDAGSAWRRRRRPRRFRLSLDRTPIRSNSALSNAQPAGWQCHRHLRLRQRSRTKALAVVARGRAACRVDRVYHQS